MPSIREEIQQTRPFPSAADEALVALLRTADALRRALERRLQPHGITLQQYNVLRILRGAGAEGLPTLDVASRMIEESPGITRLLERLETKKLVTRLRCPQDHRQVLCFATGAALRLLARLDRPMTAASERLLGPLGDDGLSGLISLLEAARESAGDDSERTSRKNAQEPKINRKKQ
jgi:DNA-binding MarR family transcriptional regulator